MTHSHSLKLVGKLAPLLGIATLKTNYIQKKIVNRGSTGGMHVLEEIGQVLCMESKKIKTFKSNCSFLWTPTEYGLQTSTWKACVRFGSFQELEVSWKKKKSTKSLWQRDMTDTRCVGRTRVHTVEVQRHTEIRESFRHQHHRPPLHPKKKCVHTILNTHVSSCPARTGSQQNNMRPITRPLVWPSVC